MTEALDYTGERMVPEKADANTFWEHIYRYRFAAALVKGKNVLDIACGEGYGTAALMRSGAVSAVGVDVSAEACEHAALRYGVKTRLGDAQNIPLENASVDTIVSFETIEHVSSPEKFLDECVRVLAPGGQIIISTPNRAAYLKGAPKNPYHLKELDEIEFVSLLAARFKSVKIFTQRPKSVSRWSPRSLSSEDVIWQRQGFRWGRWRLQKACCREIVDSKTLDRAREDPVRAIMIRQGRFARLANLFAIRPKSKFSKEVPIYFIAVASL